MKLGNFSMEKPQCLNEWTSDAKPSQLRPSRKCGHKRLFPSRLKHKLEEVTLDYNRKDQQVPSAFSMPHLEGIWDNALGTFLTFSDPSPSIDVDACSNGYFL